MAASTGIAISTYKTFLMAKESSSYSKLVDIKDFSDLGGEPEQIDVTTLSHKRHVYINGIEDADALTFTCNYTKETFTKLKALEGQSKEYAVWFGGTEDEDTLTPTGEDGKFSFTGQLSVYVNGGSVSEGVDMTVSISVSSDMKFE